VDFYSDYIGGEVRLAYYHDGEKRIPVTGISITGSASQVLSSLRLSQAQGIYGRYIGPEKAVLQGMKIF
jgi:PmbA protein